MIDRIICLETIIQLIFKTENLPSELLWGFALDEESHNFHPPLDDSSNRASKYFLTYWNNHLHWKSINFWECLLSLWKLFANTIWITKQDSQWYILMKVLFFFSTLVSVVLTPMEVAFQFNSLDYPFVYHSRMTMNMLFLVEIILLLNTVN